MFHNLRVIYIIVYLYM